VVHTAPTVRLVRMVTQRWQLEGVVTTGQRSASGLDHMVREVTCDFGLSVGYVAEVVRRSAARRTAH
jgi:hypothetical protein